MKKEDNNLNTTVISSLMWKFLERIGTQGVQFVVAIVLARLLLPSDYGAITMITVFISLSNVFVQTGFSTSLIQKKDADELDFSSVFYTTLLIALVLYLILFFTAPLIASFYEMPVIKDVLRILSLTLLLGAMNSVQNAKISRDMKFKKLFLSSLGAIILSGAVGVVFAYKGYGVWALVAQQIVNYIATTIILWFTSGWRPKLMFSLKRVKKLFSYGWKLMCSSFLDTGYQNIYNLVVGKKFSSATLGFYNKGEQFPKLIATNIDGSISSVMLPAFSKEQENKVRIKQMVRRSIVSSCFILGPMMFGLAAVANPVVKILLTDKWLGCVPFMQILCIVYTLYPIHTANLQAIKAMGKSDYFLKLEIVKKVLGIIVLIVTVPFGVYAMALGQLGSSIISTFINSYPNKKLLNYSYLEQMKDILPSLLISILMFIIVSLIGLININVYLLLIIQILIGVIFYVGISYLLKLESFTYLLNTVKKYFKKEGKVE